MTLSPPLDARADEKKQYLRELRRELSALPAGRRRDVLRDISDHVNDATEDPRSFQTIIGTPGSIATAAIRDHDMHANKPLRPGFGLISKRLQLFAAILYCPPAAYGLVMLALNGRDWPLWNYLLVLLHLAPVLLLFTLPLVARWKQWWLTSTLCFGAYIAYLIAHVVVNMTATTSLLAAKLFLVPLSTLVVTNMPALVLLSAALLAAPAVLRHSRNGR